MKTATVQAAAAAAAVTSTSHAPGLPVEPFQVLAATLCELFQMPCDEMLRHLNAQFAANPLTADFRLHLGPVAART